MTKKDLVIAILATFSLTVTIFAIMPSRSLTGSGEYDPWVDYDDNGKINILDITNVAKAFGTSGQPLVKTALLVGHANASKMDGTLSADYVQMANMSLNISLNRKSYLIIMFSAVVGVLTGADIIVVRALVNESIADPGDIVFFPEISRTADHRHWHGFTPYTYNFLQLVEQGIYTIKIEWKASEGGGAYVSERTLIVMAIPA